MPPNKEILAEKDAEFTRTQHRARVIVTQDEYNRLLEDADFLSRLEALGVSSWERYQEALGSFDNEPEPLVRLTQSEYVKLKADTKLLDIMFANNVDAWEGYQHCVSVFRGKSC